MNYYLQGFKQCKDFNGTVTRREYWMFALFFTIFYAIITAISGFIGGTGGIVLQALFIIIHILPLISITIKRLHDIKKSGWWMLISLVPIIGGIWFLILVCKPSITNTNSEVV